MRLHMILGVFSHWLYAYTQYSLLMQVHIDIKWGQGSLARKHISSFPRPLSFPVFTGALFNSFTPLSFCVL
ncbi:hypothetical protein LB506_001205 [Fusarium annulatum]|nr:hypothetical protein LB506_001205 [Fusarium annulatum]